MLCFAKRQKCCAPVRPKHFKQGSPALVIFSSGQESRIGNHRERGKVGWQTQCEWASGQGCEAPTVKTFLITFATECGGFLRVWIDDEQFQSRLPN